MRPSFSESSGPRRRKDRPDIIRLVMTDSYLGNRGCGDEGSSSMVGFGPLVIEQIAKRGSIKEADVRRIDNLIRADGAIGRAEAEMLFALQDAARVQDASWAAFFIDALTQHVVDHSEPSGYVNAENANWLMRWITTEGYVASRIEFDLLLSILERSRWAPVSLGIFALDQVRHAVVHAVGPLRAGNQFVPRGHLTQADCDTVRRILCAIGRDAHLAITRAEANALFDIDCCIEGERLTVWSDLLLRAVAHGMVGSLGRGAAERADAFAADAKDQSIGCDLSREELALLRLERQRLEIVTNEEFQDCSARWLALRLNEFTDLSRREQEFLGRLALTHPAIEAALGSEGLEFIVEDVVAA